MLGIHAYHLDRTFRAKGEHVIHDLEDFEEKIKMLESNK
jgi:hypothetical protein